jgi:hypothetical protein
LGIVISINTASMAGFILVAMRLFLSFNPSMTEISARERGPVFNIAIRSLTWGVTWGVYHGGALHLKNLV